MFLCRRSAQTSKLQTFRVNGLSKTSRPKQTRTLPRRHLRSRNLGAWPVPAWGQTGKPPRVPPTLPDSELQHSACKSMTRQVQEKVSSPDSSRQKAVYAIPHFRRPIGQLHYPNYLSGTAHSSSCKAAVQAFTRVCGMGISRGPLAQVQAASKHGVTSQRLQTSLDEGVQNCLAASSFADGEHHASTPIDSPLWEPVDAKARKQACK